MKNEDATISNYGMTMVQGLFRLVPNLFWKNEVPEELGDSCHCQYDKCIQLIENESGNT